MTQPATPLISVVVPVYKEEGSIRPFLERLIPVLENTGSYEVIFCLDPSPDNTEQVIWEAMSANPHIGLLMFSRRFGQEAATMAGIRHCSGEACVTLDVDLQDPPELIPVMYARLREGYDVVFMRRKSRAGETLPKKIIAYLGYRIIRTVASNPIPADTGDFRMFGRRVRDELAYLKEGHYFMRGLVSLVGFRHAAIEFDRAERREGATKYNRYYGSLKTARDAIFGFSSFPVTLIWWLGLSVCCGNLALVGYILFSKWVFATPYPLGIPTMTIALLFIGGVQLVSVGILGEYIGRIYDEVRRRPSFIIDRAVNVRSYARNAG